jgi:hypothetical protein
MIEISSSNHDTDYASTLESVLRGRTYAIIYLHGDKSVGLDETTVALRRDHLVVTDQRSQTIVVVRYEQIIKVDVNTGR